MNCPDVQKSGYKLYRDFLLTLDPKVARIHNRDWNLPITSKKLHIKLLMENVYRRLPQKAKNVIQKYLLGIQGQYVGPDSLYVKCLFEEIKNCKLIADYLSYSEIEKIIRHSRKTQLLVFFTVISYMEEVKRNRSSIESYYDTDFGD